MGFCDGSESKVSSAIRKEVRDWQIDLLDNRGPLVALAKEKKTWALESKLFCWRSRHEVESGLSNVVSRGEIMRCSSGWIKSCVVGSGAERKSHGATTKHKCFVETEYSQPLP